MRRRYTKALKEQILNEYYAETANHYTDPLKEFDAHHFVEFVQKAGPEHPAYDWFEWDDSSCGVEYRAWQARSFRSGVTIKTSQPKLNGGGGTTVCVAPAMISPLRNRRYGGGYYRFDPDNPDHLRDFCEEAHRSLKSWNERYELAISHAKIYQRSINNMLDKLEQASIKPKPKRRKRKGKDEGDRPRA